MGFKPKAVEEMPSRTRKSAFDEVRATLEKSPDTVFELAAYEVAGSASSMAASLKAKYADDGFDFAVRGGTLYGVFGAFPE